jgi:hypothetical protein
VGAALSISDAWVARRRSVVSALCVESLPVASSAQLLLPRFPGSALGKQYRNKCPFQADNLARFGRRYALPPIATVQHAGLAQGTFENRPIREKATASRDK